MREIKKLELGGSSHIAYAQTGFDSPVSVVFFGGFMSDMNGTKATHIFDYCLANRIGCTVFDYFGHGNSSGEFTEYGIGEWYQNCVDVINALTSGPLVIMGSSMGGWLMLLVAMHHSKRVHGLVGLAAAPDFTEDLNLSTSEWEKIMSTGHVEVRLEGPECRTHIISKRLVEDSKNYLLTNKPELPVECPMILIHGMSDTIVSHQVSLLIAEKVKSENVQVRLVKPADHSLDDPTSLRIMTESLEDLFRSASR
ncbi:MAG: alpha/beta hydrolase [Anaplasma sp.]